MIGIETYTATIYVGFRVGRTGLHTMEEARQVCREYCDKVGLCVTLSPTEYIYKDGSEPGCIVGLINYPRFPSYSEEIRQHAYELAERLRQRCEQYKVTVLFPDTTVLLGRPDTDYR